MCGTLTLNVKKGPIPRKQWKKFFTSESLLTDPWQRPSDWRCSAHAREPEAGWGKEAPFWRSRWGMSGSYVGCFPGSQTPPALQHQVESRLQFLAPFYRHILSWFFTPGLHMHPVVLPFSTCDFKLVFSHQVPCHFPPGHHLSNSHYSSSSWWWCISFHLSITQPLPTWGLQMHS